MQIVRNNRTLSISLTLIIALASALSAAHLSAHQTLDTSSISECLALHATGLDSALVELNGQSFETSALTEKFPIPVYHPVVHRYFSSNPRAPPLR